MKRTALCILLLTASGCVFSQFGGIKNKINQKVNQKVDEQIDKGIDKAVDDATTTKEKEKTSGESNSASETQNSGSVQESGASASASGAAKAAAPAFASYSKLDFLPGDKVIAFDDFSTDNVGDFPAKWNTDGSGEVVTINNLPGKWLATGEHAKYRPEYLSSNLPDNYTVEFDLAFNVNENGGSFYVQIGHAKETKDLAPEASGFQIQFVTAGDNYITCSNWCYMEECKGTTSVQNTNSYHFNHKGERIKVSLWRQKQRIRVYVNDAKLFDLPRALDATVPMNCITFMPYTQGNPKYAFISNIRVAAGAPDTRNKLITEGKFVTSGILFDVGSDKIRPESYGVMKEIATVLKENAGVKVKIIGYTDSDGDDKQNLDLSAKRAASVKANLSKEFGIEESRMQTEGKGETNPVSPNTTPEGKANNRRVEFIKQ